MNEIIFFHHTDYAMELQIKTININELQTYKSYIR